MGNCFLGDDNYRLRCFCYFFYCCFVDEIIAFKVIKVKEEEMKLKELMAQKRWNITSFAKALHKSRCTVWNWCNGHYLPNVTDIKAMAELLEVPVEEVVNCFV